MTKPRKRKLPVEVVNPDQDGDNAVIIQGDSVTPYSRLDLCTSRSVACELRKVYREAREHRTPIKEATGLAYLLTVLHKVVEAQELEDRIIRLEREQYHVN